MKKGLCFILSLAAFAWTAATLPSYAETVDNVPIMTAAASQMLPKVDLVSANKGKVQRISAVSQVTIIDVWASWCPPCRKQIPILHDLQKEYGNRINIIGISVDDDAAKHNQAIEKLHITYPSCLASHRKNEKFLNDLQKATGKTISGIPHLVIADSKGRIIYAESGMINRRQLLKIISPLLNGKN